MAELDFYMHIYGTKDAVNVEELSSADVVERKHGKWIGIPSKTVSKRNRTIHSMVYICPLCRYSNGRRKSNFCPNCGADMRGEDDGYEKAVEQMEYDMLYEPTYNPKDGSM